MIETLLRTHIETTALAAFPEWGEAGAMAVMFPDGSFSRGDKNGLSYIGTERLTAEIRVQAQAQIDRRRFIRAFPLLWVALSDGTNAKQSYQGHVLNDSEDTAELMDITFRIGYEYEMYDE